MLNVRLPLLARGNGTVLGKGRSLLPCANMQTLYETLGLSKTAKPEQIKRAYRMLVKRFHPDLFPSGSDTQFKAGERLRQINAAYGILSTPQKRLDYDTKIKKTRSPYVEPTPEH